MIVPDVETGQFMKWNSFVKNGVGLSTKNFNTVSEIYECFREMSGVDALSADMRLATIREIGQTQWAVGVVRSTRHRCVRLTGTPWKGSVGAAGNEECCSDEKGNAVNGRRQAYEDIVWALINTKEFLFNH